jgi:hypothetical protein
LVSNTHQKKFGSIFLNSFPEQTDLPQKAKDYHGAWRHGLVSGAATKPEATPFNYKRHKGTRRKSKATPKPEPQPREHGGRTEGTEKHNNKEAAGKLVRKSRTGAVNDEDSPQLEL